MEVINDKEGKRFFATVQGGDAHILYERGKNNSYDLYATYVPTESRGHQVADKLVSEAVRMIRAENVKIIDTCPYVKSWFRKHTDQRDMLEPGSEILSFF